MAAPWPATPQQLGSPAALSRTPTATSVGSLMRRGECLEGRSAAAARGADSPPPPPPPWTAAAASAPRRQPEEAPPQQPPSWALPDSRPRRNRHQPHFLEAELEEVTLRASLPEAQTAWYESARYFVSLHPSSVRLPSIELPKQVPQGTVDNQHLVFAAQPAQLRRSEASEADSECMCADFRERLSLRMDRLPSHCILYLWCHRRSMLNEDTRLLGYRALPLRDPSLHGRLAAWDVCAVRSGEEVAHVRLRYSLWTTPGPIQLPYLSDEQPAEVTLHWSPPMDDQGVKITGYRIALLGPGADRWLTVCECTTSTSFRLDGLRPSTAYMVDIRAMNEAGVGEASQLEVSTSGLEEAAPLERQQSEEIDSL